MNLRMKRLLFLVLCFALLLPALSVLAQKQYTLGISNFRDSFEFCAKVHNNI
jgi:hypothetical protein